MRLLLIVPAALVLTAASASSQTLRVEAVQVHLSERDTTAQTVPVTFDIAWEDSWRDGASWDAAWIFATFERSAGVWADLRFTPEGATADGTTEATVAPAVLPAGHARGLVIHRAGDGRGAVRLSVRTTWTYGASFFALPDAGVPVRVLGVELAHVPAGAFDLGAEPGNVDRQPNAFRAEDGSSFRVASEDALAVGEPGGLFYDVPEGEAYAGGDQAGPIPEAFPKGTDAFYVMRYPITQGQYADFLSLLPPRGRAARDVTAYPTYAEKGGTISCTDDGCSAERPARAANFLSWADGIGWASWAGLRPMTELEYEKAASGTPADSARYADGSLPDRADDSDRQSRWGIADLRGGLWERVVSVGTAEGRSFRGTPGQGYVDDLGYPYAFANPDWPGPRSVGSGYRGGTEGLLALGEVSDRTYGAYEATYGNEGQGFRAVLDAP
ncbi:MAG: SUMF1/EgtB/PvdO family nonheme iron enzyme [Bacteroidota bacterium]